MSLDEERRRIGVMHINIEHAGEVLVYMDGNENPLRYALHNGVEEAMLQAEIEYGVNPDDWETVIDRLPWKHRHPRGTGGWGSRRSRRH